MADKNHVQLITASSRARGSDSQCRSGLVTNCAERYGGGSRDGEVEESARTAINRETPLLIPTGKDVQLPLPLNKKEKKVIAI